MNQYPNEQIHPPQLIPCLELLPNLGNFRKRTFLGTLKWCTAISEKFNLNNQWLLLGVEKEEADFKMEVLSDNTNKITQSEPLSPNIHILSYGDARRAVKALQRTESSRNPMRALRKLNNRRKQMVQAFMEEFEAHPLQYADYGSDAWINSMIEHFRDPPITRILPHDIKNWLNNENYFDGLNERYDYNPPCPDEPSYCLEPEPELSFSFEDKMITEDQPNAAELEGSTDVFMGDADDMEETKLLEKPVTLVPPPQMDVKEESGLLSPVADIRETEPLASSSAPLPSSGAIKVVLHQKVVEVSGNPEVGQNFTRYMQQVSPRSFRVGVPMLSLYSTTPEVLHCFALSEENIINDLRNSGCSSAALENFQSVLDAFKLFTN
ncbi:unnamed protein product [Orchesella dallaii]|uniref:Uncharacterized protein n=1 Tax=Orchesella dallaii TaxID=48710 RepID=A0ABP1RYG3_9HEXA